MTSANMQIYKQILKKVNQNVLSVISNARHRLEIPQSSSPSLFIANSVPVYPYRQVSYAFAELIFKTKEGVFTSFTCSPFHIIFKKTFTMQCQRYNNRFWLIMTRVDRHACNGFIMYDDVFTAFQSSPLNWNENNEITTTELHACMSVLRNILKVFYQFIY